MSKLTTIKNRIYSDYILPSRIKEYEAIIQKTLELGYKHITVYDFYRKIENNDIAKDEKYFINRHDIDTDVSTAKEFFKVEKKYRVKATYYFRLSTLDFQFMKEIHQSESEASYHFEEIASYCKKRHIKTSKGVYGDIDNIKQIFIDNYKSIESRLGFKMKSVCSHGDFVNRKLGITNNLITSDNALREKLGIKIETYDSIFLDKIDFYVSDTGYPVFYNPKSIFEVIGRYNVICMLSHPRHWRSNIYLNTVDNLKRFYEGIMW